MRKYLSSFIGALLLTLTTVNAQYVTIPDSAFRSQLKINYAGCFNAAGQMDTTCASIVNETSLRFGSVVIGGVGINAYSIQDVNGIQYFKNLQSLYVADIWPVKKSYWPAKLKYILMTNVGLDSIPNFPDSLVTFECWVNGYGFNMYSLPSLPMTLNSLTITGALRLTALPALPQSLEYLQIYSRPLASLPALPTGLEYLEVSGQLRSLPSLPLGLKHLNCYNNLLGSLPPLPIGLKHLDCEVNLLDSLPPLPNTLEYLNVGSNKFLKQLPSLPNSLDTLSCGLDSSLASLPPLPSGLKILDCSGTNISCFPVLPNNLQKLYFNWNVTKCIPNMNNNIVAQYGGNLPALCNASNNVNGCTAYPVIAGYAFYDANSNGVKETNEFYRANTKIQLSNGNITFTNDSGYYEIGTTALGSYTVTPSNTFFNVSPASKTVSFSSYDTTVFQNFVYQPTSVVDSIQVSITPFNWKVNPGGYFESRMDVRNVGSGNFGASIFKITYDNTKLTFDSATNASVVNSGNILTLNLPAFPIGGRVSFNIYFTGKTTLTLGDSLFTKANFSSGTYTVSDSAITYVASSWDPNDKSATPRLSPSQVVNGKYIDYTIRYQNTGNDVAHNVVVTDTLSSQLQANTLEMISTSHQTKTTVTGNAVSFEMRNIMLPDSNVNERKSHGFISFRIKPKPTLVSGDSVKNNAAIYFDYNSPVITNNAITQIKNESTLPLKLILFKGSRNSDGNIHLYWTTANEINTKTFVIEQSSEGRIFFAADEKDAIGYGNNNYNFSIANAPKRDQYFRLKMVDKDGGFTYSPIVLIKATTEYVAFTLQQNPVSSEVILNIASQSLLNTEATIANNIGIVMKRFSIRSHTQTINVEDLPVGVYYVHTLQGNAKVLINR